MCESLFTLQNYDLFRLIANFLAFISPTCSDNRPHRRQIKQTVSKVDLSSSSPSKLTISTSSATKSLGHVARIVKLDKMNIFLP